MRYNTHMNNLTNLSEKDRAELEQIKDAILAAVPCQKIYLFGSYAYGTPHEDSDFDIYAVLADDSQNQIDAMHSVRDAVRPLNIRALDFIAQRPSVFERNKTKIGIVAKTVFEKGVLIYG